MPDRGKCSVFLGNWEIQVTAAVRLPKCGSALVELGGAGTRAVRGGEPGGSLVTPPEGVPPGAQTLVSLQLRRPL